MSADDLRLYAEKAMFSLSDEEVPEYAILAEEIFASLDPLLETDAVSSEKRARSPGEPSSASDDPLNAVIRWCSIKDVEKGLLAGKRVGLKDNMAVAGVPMTCGSRILDGYRPQRDCIVAERLLAAGAEIVAKLNMDNFAWSGSGETSDFGPILNPHDRTRTAGGSSSGSAAALYYKDIDITFGTDQGGSIRLPAAWCGTLGLKPTYGLIPYSGIGSLDPTYDHCGPLTRSVMDLALALQVTAGEDESDPRQCGIPLDDYVRAVEEATDDLRGMRLGILKESFGFAVPGAPEGTRETMDAAQEVVGQLVDLGAEVVELSVPEHLSGAGMMFATLAEGQTALFYGFGNGYHRRGRYDEHFGAALGKALGGRSNELPPSLKNALLFGHYLHDEYFSALYAKAQHLAPRLRAAYDRVFEEVDLLVMPTATHYARVYEPNASIVDRVRRGYSMIGNTAIFDATGHPALSMPAAEADGLPVGVMLVGPQFADGSLLRTARTYELAHGWKPRDTSSPARRQVPP
jgi:amidase